MTEPLEEPPQEAEPLQPPQPEPFREKRARFGLIAWVAGLTALVVVFVLLFSAFNNRSMASGGAPPSPTMPVEWERYTDPDGHFTLSIPKGWTAERQSTTLQVGNPQSGGYTTHTLFDTFGNPPWGQNTITVQVAVEPIENEHTRQGICGLRPLTPPNTTLGGLPAWHDAILGEWEVYSSGARFQIGYVYPNDKGDENITSNSPTPTPMPPGFYEKGQQDFQAILASFMPTPDTPLRCS